MADRKSGEPKTKKIIKLVDQTAQILGNDDSIYESANSKGAKRKHKGDFLDRMQSNVTNDDRMDYLHQAEMASKMRPISIIAIIFLVIAGIFLLRLLYLQVVVSGQYSAMAQESRTINFETTPRRGTIYDRNGVVLAVSVDATTIYCNPSEVTDPSYEGHMLSRELGGSSSDYLGKLTQEPSTFVYIKRQVDVDVAQRIKEMDLDGIYFISDTKREYPNGAIGGQVIGVCDVDGNGITGLELQYDELLRGTPGKYSAERGETGAPIPGGVNEDTPAIDGQDIMISLDIKLQDTVEKALAEGIAPYEAPRGSSIVMDGATGEIYAICSYPYLDPTNLEESVIGSENLICVTQPYEPGSNFKSIAALTVLEQHALEPMDTLYLPAKLQADEYTIEDARTRSDVVWTFDNIMRWSSNVGISLATEKAGFEHFNEMIQRLHLHEKTGVDYPGETVGNMVDFKDWSTITKYNMTFGQGISVTCLQMARAYGAIANDGIMTQPHFLLSLPQTGEKMTYETEVVYEDQEALDKLKGMLRSVVVGGTGQDANIDGYEVVGKTSTAEIAEEGTYADHRWNLAFVGFINHSSSKLVCLVAGNDIIYEGNVSPIFHDIMTDAIEQYNIVPE